LAILDRTIESPPWRTEDVSVRWLNEVLGRHDDFRGAVISSFDIDHIGGEFGFIREVWRIKLNYDRRTSSAPESVAVKFADRDPHLKSVFFSDTEVNTYRHLGPDSEFIMPRCYYSDFDAETGDYSILMEDLGRGRLVDEVGGISQGDAEALVKAIAIFHARWWGRTDLEQARWQPLPSDRATMRDRFVRYAQRFLERYGGQVDDEFREVISLYREKLDPILEAASSPALTLIHGDLHTANVFFDTEFRGCPVTLIDWASTARGKGATDISSLAVVGLTVEVRRAVEDSLVRLYHAILVSEGVTGYSMDQFRADYRSGFLYPFKFTEGVLGYLYLSDERGQDIARAKIERTSAALRDHDLVGLLRAM
jgi:hypothetical protein